VSTFEFFAALAAAAAVGSIFGMLFGFHCGFVWGRYRISAHEFWKRGGQL
jgi:membrane protein DedA with SNARE-associated domain